MLCSLQVEPGQPETSLVRFSIFDNTDVENQNALMTFVDELIATNSPLGRQLARVLGSRTALAVADGLGSMLLRYPKDARAFKASAIRDFYFAHESLPDPLNSEEAGGAFRGSVNQKFGIKRGQWTGFTSQALCMADSMLTNDGKFDGSSMRTWFWSWLYRGLDNCFRKDQDEKKSFGMVLGTENSLRKVTNLVMEGKAVGPQ